MSVDVAWGITVLGFVCLLGFLITLPFDAEDIIKCSLSKIRMIISITFIAVCVVCLFIGCPVINADNVRQYTIETIIQGTPDNGYTIYYDGKPADLETRKIIKLTYDSSTYHNFRVKYDRKTKELWMSEKDK